MLITGLIVGALVLIFWEVLLPGGLLGLLAAGCIVAATALAIQDYGLWVGGGLFVGTVVTPCSIFSKSWLVTKHMSIRTLSL